MTKRTYTCPVCHANVKDLKGHIARMHPESPAPAKKTTAKKLELAPQPKPKEEKPGSSGFHCIDCGQTLTRGQTPCPGCGHPLDWSRL